eukprot:TRINITY_DN3522_c0_g4_i1.p1 TRINITY_DN3522_c0_g4~~TRINITY_DN3522_c0_g4_i1.p1  ORF type:complete len:429 (-),score=101.89 TRINITY_DN3522_c0_g4_i1:88-1374(-)
MGDEDDVRASMGRQMDGEMNPYMLMEDLSDKLKLLDYEKNFCKGKSNLKPMHRAYFALPANNPNEQFFYFTSLTCWLLGKLGNPVQAPGQFDDPNESSALLVDALKKSGFSTDFSPAKLRVGYGVPICTVLNIVCDKVLEKSGFKFKRPKHDIKDTVEEESEALEEVEGDDGVVDLVDETIEEERDDENDEEYATNINQNVVGTSKKETPGETSATSVNDIGVKESTTDPAQWKLEVERMAPQLKLHVVIDQKDWRSHLDQMKNHHSIIQTSFGTVSSHLERISTDIEKSLEKISTREKYINNQFENLIREYKSSQESYLELNEKYRVSSNRVTSLTNQLASLVEDLESVKTDMEQRSSSMTDTGPVVNLKKVMSKMREEIVEMEVRIGVISHTLLQARFKSQHTQRLINPEKQALHSNALGISIEYE